MRDGGMYTVASSRLDSLLSSSVNGFAMRVLVKSEVTVLTIRTKSTLDSFQLLYWILWVLLCSLYPCRVTMYNASTLQSVPTLHVHLCMHLGLWPSLSGSHTPALIQCICPIGPARLQTMQEPTWLMNNIHQTCIKEPSYLGHHSTGISLEQWETGSQTMLCTSKQSFFNRNVNTFSSRSGKQWNTWEQINLHYPLLKQSKK